MPALLPRQSHRLSQLVSTVLDDRQAEGRLADLLGCAIHPPAQMMVCMRVCAHFCVCACVCMRSLIGVRVCVHSCVCVRGFTHASMQACKQAHLQSRMLLGHSLMDDKPWMVDQMSMDLQAKWECVYMCVYRTVPPPSSYRSGDRQEFQA